MNHIGAQNRYKNYEENAYYRYDALASHEDHMEMESIPDETEN
jgi:hypothetical protein